MTNDVTIAWGHVADNMTKMAPKAIDCYAWADGITGKVDKCRLVECSSVHLALDPHSHGQQHTQEGIPLQRRF